MTVHETKHLFEKKSIQSSIDTLTLHLVLPTNKDLLEKVNI